MPFNASSRTSLQYLGTRSDKPPNVHLFKRPPTVEDNSPDFYLGDIWIDFTTANAFMLTARTPHDGPTWTLLAGATGELNTLTGDVGTTINPVGANINVQGGLTGAIEFNGVVDGQMNARVLVDGTSIEIVDNKLSLIPSPVTWREVTTTSDTFAPNEGIVANNASLVTLTLPATIAFGDILKLTSSGDGFTRIAQNAGQYIRWSGQNTTTGPTGYLESTSKWSSFKLVCIQADTAFSVLSSTGNWDVN